MICFNKTKFFSSRNYEDLQRLANIIRNLAKLEDIPRIGIVCGSGLGSLADQIKESKVIPFKDIPGFPQTQGK